MRLNSSALTHPSPSSSTSQIICSTSEIPYWFTLTGVVPEALENMLQLLAVDLVVFLEVDPLEDALQHLVVLLGCRETLRDLLEDQRMRRGGLHALDR
eukprot:CAMPEP_0180251900 /NCGR_PEP_ID=MMETSP0987-20121128/38699_1 /TAXON_ID=697907 /ORGANISM="non described non described, Strain CCMP2293" /LENGTH=97 /DNA_ID=CAMNT_0022220503 /DNA_START=544 /DNA_END=833 /DNA_ORIENTATION=+